MRTVNVFLLALVSFAILVSQLPIISAQSTLEHQPYNFQFVVGDVVQHDADWWEIDARLENRHCENGVVYPWYRLSRPYKGSVDYKWVWAVRIDENNNGSGISAADGGGDDPPPPCPNPPCFGGGVGNNNG